MILITTHKVLSIKNLYDCFFILFRNIICIIIIVFLILNFEPITASLADTYNYNCFDADVLSREHISENVAETYTILHLDKKGAERLFDMTKDKDIIYIKIMSQAKEISRLIIRTFITSGDIAIPDNSAEKLPYDRNTSLITVCGIK